MRWLLALALLSLPLASGTEAYVVLLDWQRGHSAVGTSPLLMSPLADRLAFDVNACHRALLLDLLYDPHELEVAAEGVGEVALLYDFLVETWRGAERISQVRVRSPGYGTPLGLTSESGAHELRVSLANGANVEWHARVRGRALPDELACYPRVVVNEVEADPAGVDRDHEWIEIHNADPIETVDLSLWVIRSTHGTVEELTLASGTLLGPLESMQVVFAGQFLDNENESVELTDAFGMRRDLTPAFSDSYNDARTWHRVSDGADDWAFG